MSGNEKEVFDAFLARMGNPMLHDSYRHPLHRSENRKVRSFDEWLDLWERAETSAVKIGLIHELGVNHELMYSKSGGFNFAPAIFLLQIADGYLPPAVCIARAGQALEGEEMRRIEHKAICVLVNKVFSKFSVDDCGLQTWSLLFRGTPDSDRFIEMVFWFFRSDNCGGICNFPDKGKLNPHDREIMVLKESLFLFARIPWNSQPIGFWKSKFTSHLEDCIRILDHIGRLYDVIKAVGPETKSYPKGTYDALFQVATSFYNPNGAYIKEHALDYAVAHGSQAAHIHLARTALGA